MAYIRVATPYLFGMDATTLTDRAIVRMSGADVRPFLQGLVTNDVTCPLPVWTGLLTPQGKALFDLLVWAEGDDLLLDVEADQAEALVRRLSLYRLRRAIVIARDPSLAVHWARGGDQGTPDPRLDALGRRWIAAPSEPAQGWRDHRLALGVTEGVGEIGSDRTLWLEANARELNGVSFTKGCYVGQENTARMHHRGKVNRRLVVERHDAPPDDARAWYPDIGVAVLLRRVESIPSHRLPDWIARQDA